MYKPNRLCLCGHKEIQHHLGSGCRQCWVAKVFETERFSQRMQRAAHEFKLDNLAYLEEMAYGE